MKIAWNFQDSDIRSLQKLCHRQMNNPFVKNQKKRTIERQYENIDKPLLWKKVIGCLLTTQQRSGPNSPIFNFMRRDNFTLSYDYCLSCGNVEEFVTKALEREPGI